MAFPTTSLLVRYEAKDEAYADNDPATTITDQSGNGNDISPSSAPTFKTGIVNGQAVYRFNGTTNEGARIQAQAPTALSMSIVVAAASEGSTRTWPFGIYDTPSFPRLVAFTEGETASEWGVFFRTSAGTVQQYTSGVDTTVFTHLVMVWDGSDVTFYRDGTLVDTDPLAGNMTGTDRLAMGDITTQNFGGDIAMAAQWQKALSPTELSDLDDYVATTYGIGGGPQTVAVGQATEAETPQTITPVKPQIVAVDPATEAEVAQAITPVKPQTVEVGQATEAELGLTVTPIKHIIVPVGQATEAEIAQAITALKHIIVPVGTAFESELALVITPFGPSLIYLATATGTILGPTATGSIRTPTAVGTVL